MDSFESISKQPLQIKRYFKMKYILSILVFMLVQGRVVCDSELFPVSMFKEVDKNQPSNLPESDDIERPKGRSVYERAVQNLQLDEDVRWIQADIVTRYGFVKDPKKDEWKQQPNFEGYLGTQNFIDAANAAQQFFLANNNNNNPWDNLLRNKSPTNLLFITAARYLYVTHILWLKSDRKLIPCKETRDKYNNIIQTFENPQKAGVCFPKPYGSATYKSDYDVGLIGKDSGTVTKNFNDFFQGNEGFGKPSELVFDTNVYAFTLEFAMPSLFIKLPDTFAGKVAKLEQSVNYKMQELASAYYKVFKYNQNFFTALKDGATNAMEGTAPQSKLKLEEWLNTFSAMNGQVALRIGQNTLQQFRLAHNNQYQTHVGTMSTDGGYIPNSIGTLAKALLYAAEAYHTRGAIRHVVQGIQMKAIARGQFNTPLLTYDLWVSMIENWGEANKEYAHCGNNAAAVCLTKMSKYLYRMFNAMRLVRTRLQSKQTFGLLTFGDKDDPESATVLFLRYRKKGQNVLPAEANTVKLFLRKFQCNTLAQNLNLPLSAECLAKIHGTVNAYNTKLAGAVTDKAGTGL